MPNKHPVITVTTQPEVAAILATAYVRLRFPEPLRKEVDCAENSRPHVNAG